MNLSRLTLPLSLAALLAGGLALPITSQAHENNRAQRVEHDHHERHSQRHQPQQRVNNWYLLRHREARSYGYRPMKHKDRDHAHQPQRARHHYKQKQHGYRYYVPVRLHIGYRVVL